MSKVSIIYISLTGHTKEMAEALEKGVKEGGVNPNFYSASEMDKDAIFASDIIAMGSPASGSETIDEDYLMPFMEEDGARFANKKVFLFGSYGWGGGQYIDDWREQLESFGAEIINPIIVTLETPDNDIITQLEDMGKKLAAM